MDANVSVKTLSSSGRRFGVALPQGNLSAAIRALHEYFKSTFGEEQLSACPSCGNESPVYDANGQEISHCPYCGTQFAPMELEDEPEDAGANGHDVEEPSPRVNGSASPADSEDAEDEDEVEDESEDEDEVEDESEDEDEVEDESEDEDEVEDESEDEDEVEDESEDEVEDQDDKPQPKKRGRPPKPKPVNTEPKRKPGRPKLTEAEKAARKAEREKIVQHQTADQSNAFEYKGALVNTKEELDKRIERINEYRKNIATSAYDIGVELNHINKYELWRNTSHKNFYDFCQNTLDFSRSAAYKYMACARELDRETFLKIGVKKGELIAGARPENRSKLIHQATQGATHLDLVEAVHRLEGRVRRGNTPPPLRVASPALPPKAEAREQGHSLLGRVRTGEFSIPWLGQGTHQPIKTANIRSRYAVIPVTEDIELYLVPDQEETGLIVCFRRKTS